MMRFANSEYLWGLLLIPLFLLLFFTVSRWKKRAFATLGDSKVTGAIIPEVSFSRPWLKFILFSCAYAFLILAAAGPQLGSQMEEEKKNGADLMILLDVSNSMLAEDMSPNRLESAKRAVDQLIDRLHDDRIGIIVFAGEPYVQLPITTDYSAAKMFLGEINTGMVPTQGTAIGSAIDMGLKSFDYNDGTGKAMIIITDGENHEDDAVVAAKAAAEKDVMVNVIGMGSGNGAPIPLYRDGKQVGFHLDTAGHTVISKLDEDMCKEIAAAGHGAYVRATNANVGLDIIMNEISKVQRKTLDTKSFKNFEDRFQFPLGFALLLILAEFFISNRKSIKWSNLKLFEVKKI